MSEKQPPPSKPAPQESPRRVSRTDAQTLTEAQRIAINKQQLLAASSGRSGDAGRKSAEEDPEVNKEVANLLADLDGDGDGDDD